MTVLEIEDLTVSLGGRTVVDHVSLGVGAGDRLGLIGASGSGKSLTALAAVGLAPAEAQVGGRVRLDGREILGLPDRELAPLRGRSVGVVFQEPQTALDPLMRVGRQVAGPVRRLTGVTRSAAAKRAVELLDAVGLPDPELLVRSYPHQLSGGQRQRVGIAIALAGDPALLIADEPTTALDVTVQAEILDLLDEVVRARDTALLFISHDLAVVARVARRVAVLADGRVREQGTLEQVLRAPADAATRELLAAYRASAWEPKEVAR